MSKIVWVVLEAENVSDEKYFKLAIEYPNYHYFRSAVSIPHAFATLGLRLKKSLRTSI